MEIKSFDPVWETRYHDNPRYRNHYPWSSVVSFVYNNRPKGKDNAAIRILEVGCGNGSNLWFAAREGFQVAGIDGSQTAINYANAWFAREGLTGDFRVGDFTSLPFDGASFDLAIDRSALSFASVTAITAAVAEIRRVLTPGGRFIFNPFSDHCSSFNGVPDADGCYRQVNRGTIVPGAQVVFFSVADIRRLFQQHWTIERLTHHEETDFTNVERIVHAEWQVVVSKRAGSGA